MQAKRMQVRGWAVTWYQKEDWPRWRAICPDFAPDYDNWLARAEAGFKEHQNRGHFPEKIAMDRTNFSNGAEPTEAKSTAQHARPMPSSSWLREINPATDAITSSPRFNAGSAG
jgi:hypothetical protein